MATLWQPEGATQDTWVHLLDDDEPVNASQTVSWLRWTTWLAGAPGMVSLNPLGVRVPQDLAINEVGPLAFGVAMIVVEIERFEDGRHFSLVRQLRERHRYPGVIRAAGDVAIDQVGQMLRCGYTEFMLESSIPEALVTDVLKRYRNHYQSDVLGTRPIRSRRAGTRAMETNR